MASLPPPSTVDPHIWKSCAGTSTQIPNVGSCVYYFPEGHAEQCYSPPDFSSLSVKPLALFRCRVVDVDFLADHSTDEVFSRIRLKLEAGLPVAAAACSSVSTESSFDGGGGPSVVFFAKILTPSDANNGGGFSVPRFCADQIFPPLDYDADPPVQTITVRDVHGTAYDFRHIYRGTPRRHLLTTGWSKFVNQKKLVAGDSVVFIRNRGKELSVGVRRAARGDCGRWTKVEESGVFSRSGRGKVSPEAVVEAAGLAGAGRVFEVVYYPRMGSPSFVVPAEAVEDALSIYWAAGLRVKMAVETEDSSRMTWFQGTVTATASQELGQCSPWRMLQITWDEAEVLQNVKKVSPWQVELISTSPQIQGPFPPSKKVRHSQSSEILNDGEDPMFFPMMGLTNAMIEMTPSFFNYSKFPAGMQGARHNPVCVSGLTSYIPSCTHFLSENLYDSDMTLKLSGVSTDLNIGSVSLSENYSPKNLSSAHFNGTEPFGNRSCRPTKKDGSFSIQLFGQTICPERPVREDLDSSGSISDDGIKGCKVNEGLDGSVGSSLPFSYKQLRDQLDAHCQRASAVEACSQ